MENFIENVKRFVCPAYRNLQDLHALQKIDAELQAVAEDAIVDGANFEALSRARSLVGRIQKQWFVSKDLKKEVDKIQVYLDAARISEAQNLPFKPLVNAPEVRNFILKNHLHHKITEQHQKLNIAIKFEDDEFYFPWAVQVDDQMDTQWLRFDQMQENMQNLEFLANGLESHSSRAWEKLRPLYPLEEKEGKYVHIDTLTGVEEVIGDVGEDFVQIVNVLPWGWNPRGGSLFGHTWARLVIDGELYHLGANLRGQILNPDFMVTISRKGKNFTSYQWEKLDPQPDEHGYTQRTRVIGRIENLQAKLLKKQALPHPDIDAFYGEKTDQLYNQVRYHQGGTCTSSALAFLGEIKKEAPLVQRSLLARIVFNPIVMKILDFIWFFFPEFLRQHVILPIQGLTRGFRPQNLPR